MVDQKNVLSVLVVVRTRLVDALGQRWRTAAKHSEHVYLENHINAVDLHSEYML